MTTHSLIIAMPGMTSDAVRADQFNRTFKMYGRTWGMTNLSPENES